MGLELSPEELSVIKEALELRITSRHPMPLSMKEFISWAETIGNLHTKINDAIKSAKKQ
jgi:hypothetical protein